MAGLHQMQLPLAPHDFLTALKVFVGRRSTSTHPENLSAYIKNRWPSRWQKSVTTCSNGTRGCGGGIGGSADCEGDFSLQCLHCCRRRRTAASNTDQKNLSRALESIPVTPWLAAWSPSNTNGRSREGISIFFPLNGT